MAVAFDEMNLPGGDLRSAYHELSRWLKENPPDALEYRRQEAELLFRRLAIPLPGSRAAVPPDRHHLRGLWRRRGPRAADPLRRDPADLLGQGMGAAGKGP